MKKQIMIAALLMVMPSLAWAGDTMDAGKVRDVLNYYHSGSNVILVDYKLCSNIAKEGENKNECAEVIEGNSIEKRSKVYLWMNFFVPGDQTEKANVLLQYKYKGKAMDGTELSMPQSVRYRTWRLLPTRKSGDWQVSIEQENEAGFSNIDTISYSVVDPAENAAEM
jgi:hypothetical protein